MKAFINNPEKYIKGALEKADEKRFSPSEFCIQFIPLVSWNNLCIISMIRSCVEFRHLFFFFLPHFCYYRNGLLYKEKHLALSGNYTPRAAFFSCSCHSAALNPAAEEMELNLLIECD